MDPREHLRQNLKRLRIERGWSQIECAVAAGIQRESWSRIERGYTKSPRQSVLQKIAAAFQIPVEQLWATPKNPPKAVSYDKAGELGVNLRRYRLLRGLNQSELSKLAKVNQADISRIESGRTTSPRAELLLKLARALRIEPGQFWGRSDGPGESLDEFLASPLASDVSDDEKVLLKESILPLGDIGVKAWWHILQALREAKKT